MGLIAHLLRRFEDNGLRPRRFVLRTRGTEIEDWFWLESEQTFAANVSRLASLEANWTGPDHQDRDREKPSALRFP